MSLFCRRVKSGDGYRYFIIDSEFATKIGTPVPSTLARYNLGSTASIQADLKMLGEMVQHVNQTVNKKTIGDFARDLKLGKFATAALARSSAFFWGFDLGSL